MSLVDVMDILEASDGELTKEAEHMDKMAAEEEAAGRITARGFLDELQKLGYARADQVTKQAPASQPASPASQPVKKPRPKTRTLGGPGVTDYWEPLGEVKQEVRGRKPQADFKRLTGPYGAARGAAPSIKGTLASKKKGKPSGSDLRKMMMRAKPGAKRKETLRERGERYQRYPGTERVKREFSGYGKAIKQMARSWRKAQTGE